MTVRVRIAPSPTGYMHVGNARTVLFNWLFARKHRGVFIWRVEDTDRKRFVEGALEDFRDGLTWLGVVPDEGPFVGGDHGPYIQSERLGQYQEVAARLIQRGAAYRCFCSEERLEEVRRARRAAGQRGPYDGKCRGLDPEEAADRAQGGEAHTVRLKMPTERSFRFEDLVLGEVERSGEDLYDTIVLKSDGWPTYHLAVVVDDHAMEISHVIRADEWAASTAYHQFIYDALGWSMPAHAHVPMVLNPDGRGKLSKRKETDSDAADASGVSMTRVNEFRDAGYLPEAMFNYLCLLGWAYSGDRDIFTPEEATERFELNDVNPAPARWDPDRLNAMNAQYIRDLQDADLARRLVPFLRRAGVPVPPEGDDRLRGATPLIKERLTTLAEAPEWIGFLWADAIELRADEMIPRKLDGPATHAVLGRVIEALDAIDDWSDARIEAALRELADREGIKLGPLLQPVRVALSGQRVAPPLFETLAVLGRAEAMARLRRALAVLGEHVGGASSTSAP